MLLVLSFSVHICCGNIICFRFLCFLLFIILAKTEMNIKFFFVFALLIILYEGRKILMHLPSLIIILSLFLGYW